MAEQQSRTIDTKEIKARALAAFRGCNTPFTVGLRMAEFVGNITVNNNLTYSTEFFKGILRGIEIMMSVGLVAVGSMVVKDRSIEANRSLYYAEGVVTAFAALQHLRDVKGLTSNELAQAELDEIKLVLLGILGRVETPITGR